MTGSNCSQECLNVAISLIVLMLTVTLFEQTQGADNVKRSYAIMH